MLRIGLTGGLASGKTFVGRALTEMGCFLIEADQLGHQVMAKGAEAYGPIVAEFGAAILNQEGEIDRRRLGALVFGNPQLLEKLNAIVHPAVRLRSRELAEAFARREPHGIIVYEAAILEKVKYADYVIDTSGTKEHTLEQTRTVYASLRSLQPS